MITRRESLYAAALLVGFLARPSGAAATGSDSGIVRVRSAYDVPETVARLKAAIADQGILFFSEIDQSRLGEEAGSGHPSILLTFGNPPCCLRGQATGLSWPARLLVHQDAAGVVWVAYTDFSWMARRQVAALRKADLNAASGTMATIATAIVGSGQQRIAPGYRSQSQPTFFKPDRNANNDLIA